jgi:predicted membrane protein
MVTMHNVDTVAGIVVACYYAVAVAVAVAIAVALLAVAIAVALAVAMIGTKNSLRS